jgi:hypothetical protein
MSRSPWGTRGAAQVSTEFPPRFTARPATGPQVRVRKHVTRQVVILQIAGRLSNVVEELDLAIQLALADGPRGVVCDLSAAFEGAEPAAVAVLATAGRHVRDWPGIPVAVACSDPRVRAALTAHPLGGHLIVTASMLSALSEAPTAPPTFMSWTPTVPRRLVNASWPQRCAKAAGAARGGFEGNALARTRSVGRDPAAPRPGNGSPPTFSSGKASPAGVSGQRRRRRVGARSWVQLGAPTASVNWLL